MNDAETGNYRLKVNAQPTDELALGFSAWISRTDEGGPAAAGPDDMRMSYKNEPLTSDFDVYGMTVGYDFDNFSITSKSGYLDYGNNGFLDLEMVTGIKNHVLQT